MWNLAAARPRLELGIHLLLHILDGSLKLLLATLQANDLGALRSARAMKTWTAHSWIQGTAWVALACQLLLRWFGLVWFGGSVVFSMHPLKKKKKKTFKSQTNPKHLGLTRPVDLLRSMARGPDRIFASGLGAFSQRGNLAGFQKPVGCEDSGHLELSFFWALLKCEDQYGILHGPIQVPI